MRSLRSWLDPAAPWLARHAERLRAGLDLLFDRLREALARVVGDRVADAVREAVEILLTDVPGRPCGPHRPAERLLRSASIWDDPERAVWDDEEDDEELGEEDVPRTASSRPHSPPPRWPEALVVGLHAAAWWLRRRIGRRPLLTAVGAGLATALATYLGGSFVAAAVGLAGSAISLLSVAEAVQAGADTLAGCQP
jgi:hypothetical protein